MENSSLQSSNFLAEFNIISPLGRGAGSFVYRVASRRTSQEFALKVIDKKSKDFHSMKPRVLNEIQIHSQLKHENIVQFIGSFEDEDNIYLLLEYCSVGELYHYIKNENLSFVDLKRIAFQIIKALAYMHEEKLVHRDLKLSNILINHEYIIKLCDFGLTTKLCGPFFERTTICGTPNYISPEILNNEAYGEKIDCWSFGCVLYSLFLGHAPFEASSLNETLQRIKSQNLNFPSKLDPLLKDLLSRTLTRDIESRLTAKEILEHRFFDEERRISKYQRNYNIKNYGKPLLSTRNNIATVKQEIGLFSCRANKENIRPMTIFAKNVKNVGNIREDLQRKRNKTVHLSNNVNQCFNNYGSGYEMTLGKAEFLQEEPSCNIIETKRNRNYSQHSTKLSPIKAKDLHPCAFNLKRCRFEILKDHSLQLDIYNKDIRFLISSDGKNLKIFNSQLCKAYELDALPIKYHKFFLYGKKICEMVRSKTPKIIVNNQDGVFYLMGNEPNPNFEGVFTNGVNVFLKAFNNEYFRIVLEDGHVITNENYHKNDDKIQMVLKKASFYLKECLRKNH